MNTALEAFSFKTGQNFQQKVFSDHRLRTKKKFVPRNYIYKSVKVVEHHHIQSCTTYVEIKQAELATMVAGQRIDTEVIYLQGQGFFLSLIRNIDLSGDGLCIGVYVGLVGKRSVC